MKSEKAWVPGSPAGSLAALDSQHLAAEATIPITVRQLEAIVRIAESSLAANRIHMDWCFPCDFDWLSALR